MDAARDVARFIWEVGKPQRVGELVAHHFAVRDSDQFRSSMAALMVNLYVAFPTALAHPSRPMRAQVPKLDAVRKGDFGEALTVALYVGAFGLEVPALKLNSKVTPDETRQGPDTLAIAYTVPGSGHFEPAVIEVKTRSTRPTPALVKEIVTSLASAETHLSAAWAQAIDTLEAHPEHRRAYIHLAARRLSEALDRGQPMPTHRRDAVVVSQQRPTGSWSALWRPWKAEWAHSRGTVVVIDDLQTVIDDVFARVEALTAAAGHSPAPFLLRSVRPIASQQHQAHLHPAAKIAERVDGPPADAGPLVAASLWFLAGCDALGSVYLRRASGGDTRTLSGALAALLAGDIPAAVARLPDEHDAPGVADAMSELAETLRTNTEHWRDDQFGHALSAVAASCCAALVSAGWQGEADLVAVAVSAAIERLHRHPRRVIKPGDASSALRGCLDVISTEVVSLWPAQVRVLQRGLLSAGWSGLVVKAPTAGGKTLLISLLAASELDSHGGLVALVASSRALVQQLASRLRQVLPNGSVACLLGGFDRDDTDEDEPTLAEARVVVCTPERLELERRRNRALLEERLRLVVIDEAHHITNGDRGATLELCLAHLRLLPDVRVAMFSSQFADPGLLARWLGGMGTEPIVETARPIPLERVVYYDDGKLGYLQPEVGGLPARHAVVRLYDASPSPPSLFDQDPLPDPHEGLPLATNEPKFGLVACLAAILYEDMTPRGTVLVHAAKTGYADKIAKALLGRDVPEPELWREALQHDIGLHHASMPEHARRAVELRAAHGGLRYLVATSTLSEGVDFPVRSVLIAYTRTGPTSQLEAAQLGNLAGRAGRGGRYQSGTVVVLAKSERDAARAFTAFDRLPPAESALRATVERLRREVSDRLGHIDDNDIQPWVLGLLLEDIVAEGDLRHEIESLLGRTLCMFEAEEQAVVSVAGALERRANRLRGIIPNPAQQQAVYASGLSIKSGLHLLAIQRTTAGVSPEDFARRLIDACFPLAELTPALERAKVGEPALLRELAMLWSDGTPECDIESYASSVGVDWDTVVERVFRRDLPWCLTAALEIWLSDDGLDASKRQQFRQHGLATCIRYGVPDLRLATLIRRGMDRDRALVLWHEYLAQTELTWYPFIDSRIAPEEREMLAAQSASTPWTTPMPQRSSIRLPSKTSVGFDESELTVAAVGTTMRLATPLAGPRPHEVAGRTDQLLLDHRRHSAQTVRSRLDSLVNRRTPARFAAAAGASRLTRLQNDGRPTGRAHLDGAGPGASHLGRHPIVQRGGEEVEHIDDRYPEFLSLRRLTTLRGGIGGYEQLGRLGHRADRFQADRARMRLQHGARHRCAIDDGLTREADTHARRQLDAA